MSDQPRLVSGSNLLGIVAFPSGITRGKEATIRRTVITGKWWSTNSYALTHPLVLALAFRKEQVPDSVIARPTSYALPAVVDGPLKDPRSSWMINKQMVVTPQLVGSNIYERVSGEFSIDTENMRKFGPNDALLYVAELFNALSNPVPSGTHVMQLTYSWRMLLEQ